MKKILFAVITLVSLNQAIAQAPNLMNFQGVARNSVGNVIANQAISVRLSVHDVTAAGPVVYSETRAVTTNTFGLFNIVIGSPGSTSSSGTISAVNWLVGAKFIRVEIDPAGGASFTNIGVTQLVSVPYAFASGAATPAGPAGGSLTGLYPNPTIATGAVTAAMIAPGVIPTTLPPNGPAGGDLSGTYPNPTLLLPNSKTVSNAGALLTLTNSGTAATSSALEGVTNSTAGNAFGLVGTVSSTTPGGFSTGVRGINNGTGGLGIGVWGSQAGSGWGVYGTANGGIGVNGSANSGIGVNGASNSGIGGRFTTTSGLAVHTTGAIRHEGIGEAAGRVLTSDAAGNATWQLVSAAAGTVSGSGTLNFIPKWTPSGSQIGNSLLFDNGSSIGLGTTTPTHRLDVTHGGSTGIGVNSTAGFSVLDINAFSGDAALRFGAAGVNQWNLRNTPGTNNLQLFELGGGGERLSVQDGTGNVSIGGNSSPSYRLQVEHGGSTGILNKSTASFSVFDIDAFSGDAAIRLANNGVNQWNIRNQPGTDNLQIFELGGGGERLAIQNSTGNIAVGGSDGSYRMDIQHGGATGIRNKSTGSFSVLDIDAFSGDAAIRLANNGVNQWNIRNQPGTDNLQIFELGGGGERLAIQNTTGNIAVGGSPGAYRLDILHGGSTGILNKSTGSFSVLDIDAFTGDAAIRLMNNGVNSWNIRNQPGTDNLQIFELGGGGERMRINNTTGTVVISGDLTVLGTKAFTMDHPLDPANKTLVHAAVESNEVLNTYSGNIVTNATGKAIVTLPNYFEALNKDFRYQLTVIGSFAQAIVAKKVSNNQFEIATNQPNIEVSWQITGVRNDARMRQKPFVSELEKTGADKGKYYDPLVHNQPLTKGLTYDASQESSLNDMPKPTITKAKKEDLNNSSLNDHIKPVATKKGDDITGSVSTEANKPAPKAATKKEAVKTSVKETTDN